MLGELSIQRRALMSCAIIFLSSFGGALRVKNITPFLRENLPLDEKYQGSAQQEITLL